MSIADKLSLNKSSLLWGGILLLAASIPLSQYLSTKLLIVNVLLTLLLGIKRYSVVQLIRNSWDILAYFIVLAFGLLYSDNFEAGLRVLETNLALIAIPFIFGRMSELEEKQAHQVFYSFAIGLCAASLICLGNAFIIYNKTGATDVFFFYNLTDILYFQPTYFAYFLIFVITYGLYLIYYQETISHIIVKFISIIFLFIMLMLTGGQTAFISMLLIFAFFILKFLIEEKSKIKKVTIVLVVFMLLDMFLTVIVGLDRTTLLSDSWDRLVLWESGINAIPNPLLGVGTGDYKVILNQYYLDHGLQKFASESYNSHNQFIQLLFSNGLLGVTVLILMVARPLYLSFKSGNILAILTLFPFLIYGITEVFLGRYQGIVFFAFVHQFFIAQLNSKRASLLINPS